MNRLKYILMVVALMAATIIVDAAEVMPPDSVLRRYAAQMLMVGFRGDEVNDTCDAARYVRDLKVGAIILFDVDLTGSATIGSRNVTSKERLIKMTRQLHDWADYPLIIALDQEGGRVARLKPQYGYQPTVSAAFLGRTDCEDTTRYYAQRIAFEVAQSGVNVNLAPVVDVFNPNNPGLGKLDRCFSRDTEVIARHAGWFIDEHHKQGVLCALKHFPGHGNALNDSHWGFVDVTNTWQESELEPFQKLIASGDADLIMTAHILNRQLDPDLPATLSHKVLTELLRDKMGYEGVIVTDDMYMQGIIDNYSVENAIVMAINAGADMICVGNNISTGFEANRPQRLVEVIVSAIKDGRLSLQRIMESNARIARLQRRLIKE
ncbi:MAG: hypothetical protein J6S96_03425 [Muribaculaceae bacterium]|nr:hypothetical protein [Muribaculaceae bacterium]